MKKKLISKCQHGEKVRDLNSQLLVQQAGSKGVVDTYDDGVIQLNLPTIEVRPEGVELTDLDKYRLSYENLIYTLRSKGYNNLADDILNVGLTQGIGNALYHYQDVINRRSELLKSKGAHWDENEAKQMGVAAMSAPYAPLAAIGAGKFAGNIIGNIVNNPIGFVADMAIGTGVSKLANKISEIRTGKNIYERAQERYPNDPVKATLSGLVRDPGTYIGLNTILRGKNAYKLTKGLTEAGSIKNYRIAKTISNLLNKPIQNFELPILIPKIFKVNSKYALGINVESVPEKFSGFLLKPLLNYEKLINDGIVKNGYIDVSQLRSLFKKSSKFEKELLEEILAKNFAGQKDINFNALRHAIKFNLINYEITPATKFNGYGLDELGYNVKKLDNDYNYLIPSDIETHTIVFSSDLLPSSSKHFEGPDGKGVTMHTRAYRDKENPNTLYVAESQSDVWLSMNTDPNFKNRKLLTELMEDVNSGKYSKLLEGYPVKDDLQSELNNLPIIPLPTLTSHELYLKQNYLKRLLQENLRYASSNNFNKLAYPTSETAAKIQYYHPDTYYNSPLETEYKKIRKLLSIVLSKEIPTPKYITRELYRTPYDSHRTDIYMNNGIPYRVEPGEGIYNYEIEASPDILRKIERYLGKLYPTNEELIYLKNSQHKDKIINNLYNELFKTRNEIKTLPTIQDYSPERKTILRKYEKYPELVLEVLGITPKIEIDRNGNSWYVIDIPENYSNLELAYKKGGKLIPKNNEKEINTKTLDRKKNIKLVRKSIY